MVFFNFTFTKFARNLEGFVGEIAKGIYIFLA